MKFTISQTTRETIRGLLEDAAGLAAICFLCFAGFSLPGLV